LPVYFYTLSELFLQIIFWLLLLRWWAFQRRANGYCCGWLFVLAAST